MALSVFGVCASAANVEDYADADSITYTEAVGVLSGLGVLKGDENGFRPADTLNRAEAAKIASYLIGLQDEVVQGPSFSDVAEDNWAKGYIAICESQELVCGNGDGTYTPDGTLTGYEWEKIVLCALGYDATIEKMVGASWQGGVANLAKKTGLLNGLDEDYAAADEITREEAAQIAYNALFINTVVYPKADDLIATPGTKTLGELIFNLGVKYNRNVFGAPETQEFYNTKTKASYAKFDIEAVATADNTAKLTVGSVATAAGLAANDTALVITDGAITGEYAKATKDKTPLGAGLGSYVAVYESYEDGELNAVPGKYDIVVINTYVKVLAQGDVVKASSDGKTAAHIALEAGLTVETTDYKAGDVVVYNKGNEFFTKGTPATVAVNVAAAAPVAGYVAARNVTKNYVKLGETTADETYFSYKATVSASYMLVDNDYDVYYDDFGNILYSAKAKDAIVPSEYVYLIDYKIESKKTGLGLTGAHDYEYAAEAEVMYMDGTIETVTLATGAYKDNIYLMNEKGKVDTAQKITGQGKTTTLTGIDKLSIVNLYSLGDDTYVIGNTTKGDNLSTTANDSKAAVLAKANAVVTVDSASEYATSSTVLNVVKVGSKFDRNGTQVVTTGYQNFDAATYKEVLVTYTADGKIDTIYAVVNDDLTRETEYAIFLGESEEDNAGGRTYVFGLADGSTIEISPDKIDPSKIANINSALINSNINTVYKLSITEGLLYDVSALVAVDQTVKVESDHAQYVDGGYIKLDGDTTVVHNLAADVTKTWYIEKADKAATAKDVQEALADRTSVPGSYKGDYVTLYSVKNAKGDFEVVFVVNKECKYIAEETLSVTATYKSGVGFVVSESVTLNANGVWNGSGADALSVTGVYANNGVDGAKGTVIGYNDRVYYDGQQFTISYTYSRACNGDETIVYGDAVTAIQNAGLVYLHNADEDSRAAGILAADGTVEKLTRVSNGSSDGVSDCKDAATACKYYVYDASKSTLTEATVTVSTDDHHTLLARFNGCSNGSHYSYAVYTAK
jgi:hypothetical protein